MFTYQDSDIQQHVLPTRIHKNRPIVISKVKILKKKIDSCVILYVRVSIRLSE